MRCWNNDEILEYLSGLRDRGHLDECPGCRSRVEEARGVFARRLVQPDVDAGFFAAQRAAVGSRIGRAPGRWLRVWTPALGATAAFLTLAMVTLMPPSKQEPLVSQDDREFYREIYASVQSEVPRAAQPIQELFDDSSKEN
ncbi:MAG: hypothetical protein FJW39_28625 [Acidobacteria bacterium]|nr:hypothetical protein [Acidobacteriota bacterium]